MVTDTMTGVEAIAVLVCLIGTAVNAIWVAQAVGDWRTARRPPDDRPPRAIDRVIAVDELTHAVTRTFVKALFLTIAALAAATPEPVRPALSLLASVSTTGLVVIVILLTADSLIGRYNRARANALARKEKIDREYP